MEPASDLSRNFAGREPSLTNAEVGCCTSVYSRAPSDASGVLPVLWSRDAMPVCSAYCQISPAVIGLPTFSRTRLASSKNEIFSVAASVMMPSFAVQFSCGLTPQDQLPWQNPSRWQEGAA